MSNIEKQLLKLKDEKRAEVNSWFFKTGKGEYGEGDKFLGITVPNIRKVIKDNLKNSNLIEAENLLKSDWHEVRLAGCILMVELYKLEKKKNISVVGCKDIYNSYLKNTDRINNWDLVDASCSYIVGDYLLGKDRGVLYKLAKSNNMWDRRIAIVSTFAFIKNKQSEDTFKICEILMNDEHDLIHKACGWMLREVGKNCGLKILNTFLDNYAAHMPRTMLRYALEKHAGLTKVKYMNAYKLLNK